METTKTEHSAQIKELFEKGLTDIKTAEAVIALKNAEPQLSETRQPTEMYDKVNLMCRKYMDRMAHFELVYNCEINESAFKTTMICALETAPIFRSSVVNNPFAPYWKKENYKISDAVSVKHTDNIAKDKADFFKDEIPLSSNVQIKAALFYNCGNTHICLKWNHMCMDGGGFKAFWSDFCKGYTRYISNGEPPLVFSNGSRKYTDVYKDMDRKTAKKAKRQFANISPRDNHRFPFKTDKIEKDAVIVTHSVDDLTFQKAVKAAKSKGATVNDLLIAAYITALAKTADFNPNESISVSSAIDLRRYIKDLSRIGYTNHVSFVHCAIPKIGTDFDETLLLVTNKMKELKKDPFMGLHGLPLLNIGYKTMIYLQAEAVVKMFYRNPILSVSNVGPVDTAAYSLGGIAPFDATAAGAAKNKPCAVMTALTINGTLKLSVCLRANADDEEILKKFFGEFEKALKSL